MSREAGARSLLPRSTGPARAPSPQLRDRSSITLVESSMPARRRTLASDTRALPCTCTTRARKIGVLTAPAHSAATRTRPTPATAHRRPLRRRSRCQFAVQARARSIPPTRCTSVSSWMPAAPATRAWTARISSSTSRRRGSGARHDEVRVLLGDRGLPDPQPLASGGLDELRRMGARRVLEHASAVRLGEGLGSRGATRAPRPCGPGSRPARLARDRARRRR